jgi:septal ring factor EnvC (AmiA/AmiB activator)
MTRQIQTPGAAPDADATRDQLRAQLDALGIPYTTRDTKAELQAKLDAAQQPSIDPDVPLDPDVLSADLATDLETNYPELVQKLNAQINALEAGVNALEAENAELRAQVAKHEASPVSAADPQPPVSGWVLGEHGWEQR